MIHKYRAWDAEAEIMIYSDKHNKSEYDAEYWFEISEKGVVCEWSVDYDDSCGYSTQVGGTLEETELCTGKTDRNGTEIYQGDLIEVKTEKEHFVSEIEWDEAVAGFMFRDSKNTWCGLDAITIFQNGSSIYGGLVEVVGNIHQKRQEYPGKEGFINGPKRKQNNSGRF